MEGNGNGRAFIFRREQSTDLGELFKAWAAAKLEADWCSEIKPNASAQYGKFVNMAGLLGATEKALAKHSLVVNQTFHHDSEGSPLLLVTEIGHGGSGQFIRSILPIPKGGKIQEQKSAITYMRRAGYEALLGLAAGDKSDDDGDAGNKVPTNGGNGQWQRIELMASQKIAAAKTPAELMELLNRVVAKFQDGELPEEARDRLEKLAANRREKLMGA